MSIKSLVRTVPHYPKPGVMFRDITTLLKDPVGFRDTINALREFYRRVFLDRTGALNDRLTAAAQDYASVPEAMMIVDFIRAGEKRPLCVPRRS